MSAAFSGVIVGKRLYILVGAIIGVRTSGIIIETEAYLGAEVVTETDPEGADR